MEILGIGADIVEISRIEEICGRSPDFEERVFTEAELTYCRSKGNPFLHLAARFAGKEAVAKAFGRPFSWQEVEIFTEPSGKPSIRLSGRALEMAGAARALISLSHSRDYATAVAILVQD